MEQIAKELFMKFSVLLLTTSDVQADNIVMQLSQCRVVRADSRQEAVLYCHKKLFSLVLIVDTPPAIQGQDVFTELSVIQPGLAGILLSAKVDYQLMSKSMETGFSGVLQTPVDSALLSRVVMQAMERVRLREDNTQLRTLLPLYHLGEQFLSSSTEEDVLEGLLDAVKEQTGAVDISVMLYDPDEDCLHIAAARGMDQQLAASIRVQPGDQIAGWVFQKGKSVILNKEDQQESIFAPLLKRPEILSSISYPMIIRGQIIGVLNISQTESNSRFSEADNEMLAIVCSQAAMALENVRSLNQIATTTRMRTLFEQYVSPEIAELLIAQDSNLMGLGEIQMVTVLFADIRNFTGLVQRLELSDLRSFLNEFFQVFTETIFEHRGTIDKFMGDAVLAIFGTPLHLENANYSAVTAALTIKGKFEALRERWSEQCRTFHSVDLGIAITRGEVFFGNIGSSRRLDYTVIGNQVNIAQRLAAESSGCRIYTTESVVEGLGSDFSVEILGARQLRGVDEKIEIFSIEGKSKKND